MERVGGSETRAVCGEELKGAALAGSLSSCAGRAGGANLGPGDRSRPAGGRPPTTTVQRLCC
jgi:hypothetical protein